MVRMINNQNIIRNSRPPNRSNQKEIIDVEYEIWDVEDDEQTDSKTDETKTNK